MKILELTDSFGVHRESVFIALATEKDGSVSLLPDGRLHIVCPDSLSFDAWLTVLKKKLQSMDLSKAGNRF